MGQNEGKQCKMLGCGRDAVCKLMCNRHYERQRLDAKRGGPAQYPNRGKTCTNEVCDRPAYCKGLCTRHYELKRVYGKDRALTELSDWEGVVARGWQITDTGCWEYRGKLNDGGYGIFRAQRVHRISYRHHYGEIPEDRPHVLHACDNPPCLNPQHLRAGTREDNMADMMSRGRHRTQRRKYTLS